MTEWLYWHPGKGRWASKQPYSFVDVYLKCPNTGTIYKWDVHVGWVCTDEDPSKIPLVQGWLYPINE